MRYLSGNYNGTVSIHNGGSGGSFNGDGAGNGGKGGDGKGTPPPPPDIRFNPELERHLANVDGVDRNGIKGGHNQDNFMKELERLAALDPHGKMTVEDMIVRREPTATDGIDRIYYKIPTFDGRNAHANGGKGNISGYKEASSPKTVYDPAKYSDKEMFEMAKKAAEKRYESAMKNNLKEDSVFINGIEFRIYFEQIGEVPNKINTGVIKNVHPK